MKRGSQRKFHRNIRSAAWLFAVPDELSDQCRSICTPRGGNFLKRHKGVQGYPFETVLHFYYPTLALIPFIDGDV
jgi:hypothetical protein